MKIILLTRIGRPSGQKILQALVGAKKDVAGVVAEKRGSLLLKNGIYAFFMDSIQKHGFLFLWNRLVEYLTNFVIKNNNFLQDYCKKHKIPYRLVDDHNAQSTEEIIKSIDPDILITANTRIIKENIIKIPQKAALNCHSSKLPAYAGLDSIFWALYHGEKEIGVSVHHLEVGLDTGDIIVQETLPVMPDDNVEKLTDKANDLGAKLAVKAIEKFEIGDFNGFPQDRAQRTYFSWPTPAQRKELLQMLQHRLKNDCAE